jgi:hypothetical protein
MRVESIRDGYLIVPETSDEELRLQEFIKSSQTVTVETQASPEPPLTEVRTTGLSR